MLFSFEGIDGSGKSTQARLLAAALRERGFEVVDVREPGGTEVGERIRALLLSPDSSIAPRAELLLFSAARAQLVDEVVRPALGRDAVVVVDRYFDSSTAYQGGGRGLADSQWLDTLHHFATAGLTPDRTYLVDLDVEAAAKRRGGLNPDRMESGTAGFHEAVRQTYHAIAARHPERVRVLDGHRAPQELHGVILTDALERLDGSTRRS
ncbi:dTMP kinase [Rubrivirga sp.]|uniref:dTMP kinase n=1 Tax=Rubrivirga sp. TaxID=1885344 RepID=UPI003B521966